MKDLIKALQIFLKYDEGAETHCEHDTMYALLDPSVVSDEDKEALDELGFHTACDVEGFESTRHGSA